MSIESIGNILANTMPQEAIKPLNNQKEVLPPIKDQESVSGSEPTLCSNLGMNTKDFLILRTQSSSGDYAILDEVIARMKENIEESGDALEGIIEKIQKTLEMAIGLQLLKATFDAIDKIRQGPGGTR